MIFTNAQYILDIEGREKSNIRVEIDGVESLVPLDPNNMDYAEIMRQIEAGTLTIAEAD